MSSPLADLIQRGESGATSYDNYNRGTYIGDDDKEHVRGADRAIDFSSLSIGQVLDRQALARGDANRLFAVGRYQVIPDTMNGAVISLGLDRNAAFTDAVQDRVFSDYLITDKRPSIRNYITGAEGATLQSAQLALSQEWASIANPSTGKSYYDKPGGANHASITADETAGALNQMRDQYQKAIAEGNTSDQAWAQVNAQPAQTVGRSAATRDPLTDGMLVQGEKGEAVKAMQEKLGALGYVGADGKPLVAGSDFGRNTRAAVEQFQRDHGLEVDGKAGRHTFEALDAAVKASGQAPATAAPSSLERASSQAHKPVTLADAGHPDHARYGQAMEKLQGLEAQRVQAGLSPLFGNKRELENAAGQVAFESKVAGMNEVSTIVARRDGAGVFVVNGALGDPAAQRVYVDREQAVRQSVEASTRQLSDFNRQFAAEPAQPIQLQTQGVSR
jgi:peptidoglycan hydrolase-like protein with peptidoglycan-binding domain